MKPIPVTDKFSVLGQLQPKDFAELVRRGYKTVINNRPDGEEGSQPGSAAEEEAARAAGLDYVFIPVTSSNMRPEDVRRFAEAIVASDGPVIAHCRSFAGFRRGMASPWTGWRALPRSRRSTVRRQTGRGASLRIFPDCRPLWSTIVAR